MPCLHPRHQDAVAELLPALLRIVDGEDVKPPSEAPAAWNVWPSGRLSLDGCTAARLASYCSFVPPGK